MKQLHFFKGLSWLLLLNVLIKPVWIFAIDREVQNSVGHAAYGTYFSLFSLSFVFLFIADAGLSTMMAQRIAGDDTTNAKQLLQAKGILLIIYILACCLTGWLSGITQWPILFYVVFIQGSGSLFLFLRSVLAAHQRFKTDAFFSVADKSLLIILCSPFLYGWWQPITIETFLQLQAVTISMVTVFLLYLLLKKGMIASGRREKAADIFYGVLPFAAIFLLMGMHYRLDGFLLERMRTDGAWQAGIYATAYRLLDATNMLGYLTASFLVPFIAKNKTNNRLLTKVISLLQHGLMGTAIFISCFAFVFAPSLQEVLYKTTSVYNSTVIQLCLTVLPAYFLTHIHGSVLTATNNRRSFIVILSAAVFVNVLLNILLIPALGAVGSCIAALISQYGSALAIYFVVCRRLSLPCSVKHWLGYTGSAALLLVLLFGLKGTVHSFWISLAVITALPLIIAITQIKFLKRLYLSYIQ